MTVVGAPVVVVVVVVVIVASVAGVVVATVVVLVASAEISGSTAELVTSAVWSPSSPHPAAARTASVSATAPAERLRTRRGPARPSCDRRVAAEVVEEVVVVIVAFRSVGLVEACTGWSCSWWQGT